MSGLHVPMVPADGRGFPINLPAIGPADVIDLGLDFGAWLALAPFDAIAGFAASPTVPTGAIVTAGTARQQGTAVVVRIGPGTPCAGFITAAILTAQGRRKTVVATFAIVPPA